MAALTKLLIAVFFIQATLILFGIAAIPGDAIYNFLTNPITWSGVWMIFITDLSLTIGGAALIAGTFLIKSDLLVFAGIAGIFLSFGKSLSNLFTVVSASSDPIVAWLVVSPIILIYFMTVIAWWRGRD
jgi:hypothetical protein